MPLRLPAHRSHQPARPGTVSDLEKFTRARGLRVRRQQRPVDEVANLQICQRSSKVTVNGSEAQGAQLGYGQLRPRVHRRRVLKRLNLARRNFSSPYLVSLCFDYIVHLAGWDPSDIYDPTPELVVLVGL